MKKQFVTYEIALKLKELGFDEKCFGVYYDYKGNYKLCFDSLFSNKDIIIHTDEHSYCALCLAPLWQQVIDWLDSKNIFIAIIYLKSGKFFVSINNECDIPITDDLVFEEYENRNQAIQQAILKALEIITNK